MEHFFHLNISLILFLFTASSFSVKVTNEPLKEEIVVNSLLREFLSFEPTEVVLVRDYVTSKSTSLITESVSNSSLKWNNIVFFQWNNQQLPSLPRRHIEYNFSWLDRPWRVQQSNKILLIVVVMKENFKSAIEYVASYVSLNPYHLKVVLWFPNADMEETDAILLDRHASFFKNKVGLSLTDEETITLRSVCFFCNKGEPMLTTPAVYKMDNNFNPETVFVDYTRNMNGKRFRGTFLYPWTQKSVREMQKNHQPVNSIEAYVVDLFQYMNADMYVEVHEVPPPNVTALEVEQEDGMWYGQTGEILRGTADFGAATHINTPLLKVAEFPHVFTFAIWKYATRKPRPAFGWYAISQPFTVDMWIAILIAACFGILTFRFILWTQSHFLNPFHPRKPPSMVWGYCLSYIFLPLMEENPPKVPTSHTARTFVAFWWAYATIITCCYDTKLIGFLAAPELESIPQSFRAITETNNWNLVMQQFVKPYFASYSLESQVPHHHKVNDRLQATSDVNECLQRTLVEDTACVDADVFLIPFSMFHIDKFGKYPFKIATEENNFDMRSSTFVAKHSVIAPSLWKIGLTLHSNGILDRDHKEFPKMCKLVGMRLARANNVYYEDYKLELVVEQLKGPLMLMVVFGWILPFILFIKEVTTNKTCCQKSSKK